MGPRLIHQSTYRQPVASWLRYMTGTLKDDGSNPGHEKIRTAVQPLSKALNLALLHGDCPLLGLNQL